VRLGVPLHLGRIRQSGCGQCLSDAGLRAGEQRERYNEPAKAFGVDGYYDIASL
jgi:hypothetical protein